MREHWRGPKADRACSYPRAVRPFASRKGGPQARLLLRYVRAYGRQSNPIDPLCAATSFLRAEKGGKKRQGGSSLDPPVSGFNLYETDRRGISRRSVVLFGSENPVAGIAEAGHDISMVIEMLVQRRTVYLHVGMGCLQCLQPFRRGNDAHELDVLRAPLLIWAIASTADPPVASIGSRTITSRSVISLGSLL